MGLDLATKTYKPYDAFEVYGSDLLNSGKWQYAIYDNTQLNPQQTKDVFNYYQSHPYLEAQRYAYGALGNTTAKFNNMPAPIRPAGYERGADFGRNPLGGKDYFKTFRLGNYGLTSVTRGEGDKAFRKIGTVKQRNYLTGDGGGVTYNTQEGRLLNNTFIAEDVYSKLSSTDKLFYGLTPEQARRIDPDFDQASQIVDAAYQYRRGRARKKTGLNAAVSVGANLALPAIAALSGNPYVAASVGGFSGLKSGGDFTDIALGAASGFFGSKALGNNSIWSDGGAAVSNAGPAQLQVFNPSGGGNVSFFDNLVDFGKDIFGGVNDIFGGVNDIFGTDFTFGDILSTGLEIYGSSRAADQVKRAQERASRTSDAGASARSTAGGQLDALLSDPSRARNLPGFEDSLALGEKAIIRERARTGGRSGGKLLDLAKYNQDFTFRNFSDYATLLNQVTQGSPQQSAAFQQGAGVTGGQNIIDTYGALGELFSGGDQTVSQQPGTTVFNPGVYDPERAIPNPYG